MTSFVTRSGSTLQLNGNPFRFGGVNIFWLGALSQTQTPTHYEVDDALSTAASMGLLAVRAHTLGVSTGYANAVEPSLGTFNSSAFTSIDYAIKRAGDFGLKLIIPLTDNYHYYHGGKYNFTTWRSISDETQFYTNATVISDFELYINTLLTHVNTLTGIAYKDDPTIMIWETGNELHDPTPPTSWTTTIANYIKSVDSNHLVMDGSEGINSNLFSLSTLDVFSNHSYPLQYSIMTTDITAMSGANQAYIVGEFDWRPNQTQAGGILSLDTSTFVDGTQSARVDVTSPGTHIYYVQLIQAGLSLTNGKTYTVSFYAKSLYPDTIQVAVQSNVSPFTVYLLQSVTVGTTWQQYSYSFTMSTSDSNAFVAFNVADIVTSIWFDIVSITASGVSNIVSNPSFDNSNSSLSPWSINIHSVTPTALASFDTSVEGNTAISGDCFWSLMAHSSPTAYITNNDGYSLYYPGQDIPTQTQILQLRAHAYNMSGTTIPPTYQIGAGDGVIVQSKDGFVTSGKDGR